jgi:hypothetical protein
MLSRITGLLFFSPALLISHWHQQPALPRCNLSACSTSLYYPREASTDSAEICLTHTCRSPCIAYYTTAPVASPSKFGTMPCLIHHVASGWTRLGPLCLESQNSTPTWSWVPPTTSLTEEYCSLKRNVEVVFNFP